jgi:hypothetical protein
MTIHAESEAARSAFRARLAAIAELEDQVALARLATKDPNHDIRMAAVERLTDQQALAKVALKDSFLDVRKAAGQRLTDQQALAKVAKNDKNYLAWVRKARRNDNDSFYEGLSRREAQLRITAVMRVTDPTVLADIAKNDKDPNMRMAATMRITDPALLAEIARDAKPIKISTWGRRTMIAWISASILAVGLIMTVALQVVHQSVRASRRTARTSGEYYGPHTVISVTRGSETKTYYKVDYQFSVDGHKYRGSATVSALDRVPSIHYDPADPSSNDLDTPAR